MTAWGKHEYPEKTLPAQNNPIDGLLERGIPGLLHPDFLGEEMKTADARDFTKAPAAELDVPWTLKMQRRIRDFQQDPTPRAWPYAWQADDWTAAK